MDFKERFTYWKTNRCFDAETRAELDALTDGSEIEDRFRKELEFGTGGLRGLMGAGTNRVNKYTVGRAAAGLGQYLKDAHALGRCKSGGVAIAYDTRCRSRALAETAADVLTGMGIKAYVMRDARPTPQLSFTVRHLGCMAGIVLTASHNPKEYNGCKVYDEHGCQMVPKQALAVSERVDAAGGYADIKFAGNDALKEYADTTDAFVDAVLSRSMYENGEAKAALRVVYTPLHGAGLVPVCDALRRDGFTSVSVVPEQERPDGDFPTVESPNPEERGALALGVALAESQGADIVIGTDPDGDRVGVGARAPNGGYGLLTGNQIGALLADYVLGREDISSLQRPAIVKTVVTSELGAEIARSRGLRVFDTLTGFKYIGEKITQFENARGGRSYTFVMGYEESYGYLVGTHARDKDAVVSSMLICEMAAEYKAEGKTLFDRLYEIYARYGYYRDELDSFAISGAGAARDVCRKLRGERPFADAAKLIDYSVPVKAEPGFGMLPASDVLKYVLRDGSWAAVRPSGTEPKLKIYYSAKGRDRTEAGRRLEGMRQTLQRAMSLA
ncbi:MAG: phospho-sugar mutase [Oscillospiraceae bacterium]|jgi:phosphoglucomutase|nr:phospho-sugar mutase [Oscillospiraceae bacterium]